MAKDQSGLSKDERDAMRKVLKIVYLLREIDTDMSIQTVTTLLGIAANEGTSLREMADKLGIANSTASRCVAQLSKVYRPGKDGLDLVLNTEDPLERRRKLLTLTDRGKVLRDKIIATINAG